MPYALCPMPSRTSYESSKGYRLSMVLEEVMGRGFDDFGSGHGNIQFKCSTTYKRKQVK